MHDLLQGEGLVINEKGTFRMYVEERIQVRSKKYKKPQHPPLAIKEFWSMSLVSDQQIIIGSFGFNLVDDYSRDRFCLLALPVATVLGLRIKRCFSVARNQV